MAGRKTKPETNRHNHHQSRVDEAETPKSRLWAYCHWLVAEAFHAGPAHVDAAVDLVRDRITELADIQKDTR